MNKCAFTAGRKSPVAVALALAFGAGTVQAQPLFSAPWYGNADMTPYSENHITITPIYAIDANAKFGEWTGVHKGGMNGVANLNLGRHDDATGLNWNVAGFNLGLSSAMASAQVGQQGKWVLKGSFQGVTHYLADDAKLRYVGWDNQTLLPAFNTGTSAGNTAATGNPANYASAPVDLRRVNYGLGGGLALNGNWSTFVDVQETERKGGLISAGNQFSSKSALTPVDDQTQQLSLGVRYSGEEFQAEMAYKLSRYRNNMANDAFTINTVATGGAVTANSVSLAPDSDWNQVAGKFAYRLAPHTRVSGAFGYSWTTQDSAFVTTGGVSNKVWLDGAAQSSLNGELKQSVADLTVTSRPWSKIGLRANYNYLNRDNTTSQYKIGSAAPVGDCSLNSVSCNVTPSYVTNRVTLEGDYSLARRTKLRAWYQYKDTDYGPSGQALRPGATNNQLGTELIARGNESVSGSLRYQYDKRSGGEYTEKALADWIGVSGAIRPTLRQYWVANYEQNAVRGQLNFAPANDVAIQLRGDWMRRAYNGDTCVSSTTSATQSDACLGLQNTARQSYTLDTQWTPTDALQLFAFYTFGKQAQDQLGNSGTNLGAATQWSYDTTTKDNTIGLGLNAKLNERWSLGSQVNWVRGTEAYVSATNGVAQASQFPVNKFEESSMQVYGSWKYTKDVTFRANYQYASLRSNAWNLDGVSVANWQYSFGLESPQFKTHLIALTANFRVW